MQRAAACGLPLASRQEGALRSLQGVHNYIYAYGRRHTCDECSSFP